MADNLGGVTNVTGLAVGGGGNVPSGVTLYGILNSVVTVVATTVTATKSVDTTATFSGVTVGDAIMAIPKTASGLSAGVTVDAWVSAADTATIRYSNVSTANAAQIATAFNVIAYKLVP